MECLPKKWSRCVQTGCSDFFVGTDPRHLPRCCLQCDAASAPRWPVGAGDSSRTQNGVGSRRAWLSSWHWKRPRVRWIPSHQRAPATSGVRPPAAISPSPSWMSLSPPTSTLKVSATLFVCFLWVVALRNENGNAKITDYRSERHCRSFTFV